LSEWQFVDDMPRAQRERLTGRLVYEDIVARLVREARLAYYRRERARAQAEFFRVHVTLAVNASTVDLFHSAPAGYRAQYYRDPALGDEANAFALRQLAPRIVELVKDNPKQTCRLPWIERSLLDRDAKIWIHQGLWLRHARREDRQLAVARWIEAQESSRANRRKKAIWASLTPARETMIDVKGGFIALSGDRLGTLKRTRAREIHEVGFT
jgi:hypothetical protein